MIYALTVSLTGIDWMESLEPNFHSPIYGFLFLSFTLLSGLAFMLGISLLSGRRIGRSAGYSGLLLSLILLWAYLHAMQYIVIWSGNIPVSGAIRAGVAISACRARAWTVRAAVLRAAEREGSIEPARS
ncbi:hypothetical protein [Bradyrhizobium altum]|uniref:hypothetical protein n=1 Tax=Bradyrhizobium altum TaxID=1571202 RepID=UPI001E40E8E9|nr:hypothetical protein [Bradyrhizobium altum]